MHVFTVTGVQPHIDVAEYDVFLSVGIIGFQNERAHDRAEGKRHDCGYDDRYGNRNGKLPV